MGQDLVLKNVGVTGSGTEIYASEDGELQVLRSAQTREGFTLHWLSVGARGDSVPDEVLLAVMGRFRLTSAVELAVENTKSQLTWMGLAGLRSCREVMAMTVEDGEALCHDPTPAWVPDGRKVVATHCPPGRN